MKGIIVINPFLTPKASVNQANRLKHEFDLLGVETETVSDGYLRTGILGGKTLLPFSGVDFCVYLDKDKYLSKIIEDSGVRLFNSHSAIRVCDDKAQTYIALSGSGVPIPDTVFGALCYDKNLEIDGGLYDKLIERLGLPMIVKECYGSMGKGVYLAKDKDELKTVSENLKTKPHLFQKYYGEKVGTDVRVIVIGGKAVASMQRHNDSDFRSNVALGGSGSKIELSKEFKDVSEKVAKLLKLDYCGVDLLYGKNGEPVVCEVNSNAFFDGIESVSKVNVGKLYAEYIVGQIKK